MSFSRINIYRVLKEHIKTFKSDNKYDWGALFFDYAIPLLLVIILLSVQYFFPSFAINIKENIIASIISAFAIFGGLLFALPMSIVSLKQNARNISAKSLEEKSQKSRYCKLLDITFNNLNYCIALSMLALIITISLYFLNTQWYVAIALGIYLHIIITAMNLFKKIHSLMLFSLK